MIHSRILPPPLHAHLSLFPVAVQSQTVYPNIRRALEVIANLTSHFSTDDFSGTVVGIELVNEAFVTIPIEVVKDYYLQGYEIVKQNGDTMAVIIGDSFRFGAWNDFMFPPHYRHVWIDTHIYQGDATYTAHENQSVMKSTAHLIFVPFCHVCLCFSVRSEQTVHDLAAASHADLQTQQVRLHSS